MSVQKNVVIRLEAGGRTITAGTGEKDFGIYEMEGLSGLEFDFKTTARPQSPNAVIYAKKPLPRHITLGIRANGERRAFLTQFFNPFIKGKMSVTWNGITRFIYYYPYPVKIEQQTVYRRVNAEAELFCPEPYWLDPDDFGKNIASKMPLTAFPFVMRDIGMVPDYRMFNQEVSILNKGDTPTHLSIVFTAVGYVRNPCLTLNGKEFVRAVVEMEKGDKVEFSTDPDDLYARMNGEDILNQTDPKMTFFQLSVGDNIVEYSADEGTSNLNVYIFTRARYVGV